MPPQFSHSSNSLYIDYIHSPRFCSKCLPLSSFPLRLLRATECNNSMPMATLAYKANLSQILSFENKNRSRDPSFSSYLNNSEQHFIGQLSESTRVVSSCAHKEVGDQEIDVFAAEKYFNGVIEPANLRIHNIGKDKLFFDTESGSGKIKSSTPSVHSASSRSSRNALLTINSRNGAPSKVKKEYSRKSSFLSSLGCRCNGKNSVEIKDPVGVRREDCNKITTSSIRSGDPLQKTMTLAIRTDDSLQKTNSSFGISTGADAESYWNLREVDCFAFLVMNSKIVALQSQQEEREEREKKSQDDHFSLARRLSLTNGWDLRGPSNETDYESDASSDLFEIDCFSTNKDSLLPHKEMYYGTSGCVNVTPTTCYAPSKASIQWSAITAGEIDFEELHSEKNLNTDTTFSDKGEIAKGKQKKRLGILSGCTSLKAVQVRRDEHGTSSNKWIEGPREFHQFDYVPQKQRIS